MVKSPDSGTRHPSRAERALGKLANPLRDSADETRKLTHKAIKASQRRLDRVDDLINGSRRKPDDPPEG